MTGSIVTFDDAIPFMPIEKLVAQIEPQQDLHGYDNPWPAGGGKQLLNPATFYGLPRTNNGVTATANNDGTISLSGTATENAYLTVIDYKTLSDYGIFVPDTSYTFSAHVNENVFGIFGIYGSGTDYVDNTGAGRQMTFTSEQLSSLRYRIVIYVANGTNTNGMVIKPMICLASASNPTTFAPYSNICPISGWTGLSGGLSPCVPDFVRDGIQDSTGADAVNPARARTDYLPISLLDKTTNVLSIISAPETDLVFRCAYWYKADKTFISNFASIGSSFPINIPKSVIPSDAEYFRFVIQHSDSPKQFPVDVSNYFISINANPITVSWQTEAGTVYGGTVDVVTGVLTVDRATITVDGSQSFSDNGALSYGGHQAYFTPSPAKKYGILENYDGLMSDKFAVATAATSGNVFVMNGRKINRNVYFNMPSDVTSADLAKTWFTNNPTQVSYLLATPQTYQLTPQQISTLLGNNTVFVDTGDVSVTYQSTSGSTPVRTSLRSPLASYSYNSLKLFGNTFIEHGKG